MKREHTGVKESSAGCNSTGKKIEHKEQSWGGRERLYEVNTGRKWRKEKKDRESVVKKEGGRTASVPGLQVCRRHVETAMFLQRHTVSRFVSVRLLASFPSVSLSHLYFYRRGN